MQLLERNKADGNAGHQRFQTQQYSKQSLTPDQLNQVVQRFGQHAEEYLQQRGERTNQRHCLGWTKRIERPM